MMLIKSKFNNLFVYFWCHFIYCPVDINFDFYYRDAIQLVTVEHGPEYIHLGGFITDQMFH